MTDADRDKQRAYAKTRAEAEDFVDESSAFRLPDDIREVAIADAQRVNLDAWRAWVDHGSREDWSQRLGSIDLPVLLICGEADEQVPGPDEQRRTTLAAFTRTQLEVIPGAGHLMPMQTPRALAELMLTFAREQCDG
jgi:pimeloyl-ACP methyl ester carboxylesterase